MKGVMASFVHYRGVPVRFMESMTRSLKAGAIQDYVEASSARINAARTENIKRFLESDREYILFVDTDMSWEPEDVIKLKQFAQKKGVKAVSGWTLMPKNGLWPHAFRLEVGTDYVPWGTIEPFGPPIKVDAVGGACFLVHREVIEAVKENYEGKTEYLWQDEPYVEHLDLNRGEDVEFSRRITEAGYDIWYHPDAIFIHWKEQAMGPAQFLQFRRQVVQAVQQGEYSERGDVG